MKLAHIILLYLTRVTFQVFLVCRTENMQQFVAYEELKKGYSQYFGTPINKKLVKP